MSNLTINIPDVIDASHLEQLRIAAGDGPVHILTHDNPDPDALASGKALSTLLKAWKVDSRLIYSGLVARAENRAMLERLTPEWQHSRRVSKFDRYSAVALVDTQPGAGNNRLPIDHMPQIVIDHHRPPRETIAPVPYADVRPEIGATSTMLFQYLEAAEIELDPILATAMFYGLKTDTRGLARSATPADEFAYLKLLSMLDRSELVQVEQAGLPRRYFRAFIEGLQAARVYDEAIVARLGRMLRPDLAAEMADLLIRLDVVRAVLCLGVDDDTVHLSLRLKPLLDGAGDLIQKIVGPNGMGGGHRSIAGGQVPLDGRSADEVMGEIEQRFLNVIGARGEATSLLSDDVAE
jgi:nanoRNase/pAp phosphatase (c-di-AMP/oligoRNAs hydrolase)